MRVGERYELTMLRTLDEPEVFAVSIENRTRGLHARGRPSRDLEEAERTAWAAMSTVEGGD